MRGFAVAALEPLALERGPAIRNMYALSPYVWPEGGGYSMMLRIVPDEPDPADKIARIHYGRSEDGLHFVIDDDPVLAPGPIRTICTAARIRPSSPATTAIMCSTPAGTRIGRKAR